MEIVTIGYDAAAGEITLDKDPLKVSVEKDKAVRWKSSLPEWRVIFAADAPVNPKVASPGSDSDKLDLKGNRPGDHRHAKYTVVAMTKDGLKHLDPELIVDP